MKHEKELVGLICNDIKDVDYFVLVLTSLKRYTLKTIWCPDAEKTIQLAADSDIPSVSHTAFQLISRSDIQTIIIGGHPHHKALFCGQAQALMKRVVCIGTVCLSIESAQTIDELLKRNNPPLNVIYPLKYSNPMILFRSNLKKIGRIQAINVDSTFIQKIFADERLRHDFNIILQTQGHEIIDALHSLCVANPKLISSTNRCISSVVDHFRIRELEAAHFQIAFDNCIACIHILASKANSLSIRAKGTDGTIIMDANKLVLEVEGTQCVLWCGDGSVESVVKEGIMNALSSDEFLCSLSELSLVQCCSVN